MTTATASVQNLSPLLFLERSAVAARFIPAAPRIRGHYK